MTTRTMPPRERSTAPPADAYRRPRLADTVLDAIVNADGDQLRCSSEAALICAAWAADTARLGLRGYSECYPDSKRVYRELLLLKGEGLILRTAPLTWRLTEDGRGVVRRIRKAKGAAA